MVKSQISYVCRGPQHRRFSNWFESHSIRLETDLLIRKYIASFQVKVGNGYLMCVSIYLFNCTIDTLTQKLDTYGILPLSIY